MQLRLHVYGYAQLPNAHLSPIISSNWPLCHYGVLFSSFNPPSANWVTVWMARVSLLAKLGTRSIVLLVCASPLFEAFTCPSDWWDFPSPPPEGALLPFIWPSLRTRREWTSELQWRGSRMRSAVPTSSSVFSPDGWYLKSLLTAWRHCGNQGTHARCSLLSR